MRARLVVLSVAACLVMGSPALAASAWRVVPSPGGTPSELASTAFTSTTDGWAVGVTGASLNGTGLDTLTERWDGSSWRVVPSPALAQSDEALTGVSSTGPTDAWAVGWHDPYGTTRVHGLILHWDGQHWVTVQDADHSPIPVGVDARTPQDVWAVGSDLFEHFDGTSWHIAPEPSAGVHPRAVAVLSANDAWAVGGQVDHRAGYHHDLTYLAHWDGKAWSSVPSPLGLTGGSLSSVSVVSPTDIWAVGSVGTGGTLPTPVAIHYDGATWSQVPTPTLDGAALSGVVARSASDVWAVGSRTGQLPNGNAVERTLTEHWNGATWSIVTSRNDSANDNVLDAVAATTSAVWAVGGDGGTLVERR